MVLLQSSHGLSQGTLHNPMTYNRKTSLDEVAEGGVMYMGLYNKGSKNLLCRGYVVGLKTVSL